MIIIKCNYYYELYLVCVFSQIKYSMKLHLLKWCLGYCCCQ